MSWVENRALDAQWGIDNLTKLCEADAKCKEAYDIPALVDAALALFDNGPLPYTYTDPNDPSLTVDGEVTVNDMVGFIYGIRAVSPGLRVCRPPEGLVEGGAEAVAEFLGARRGATSWPAAPPPRAVCLSHAHGHGLLGRSREIG